MTVTREPAPETESICQHRLPTPENPTPEESLMSLKMSTEEREAFLADLHVGMISITEPGRAPLVVPIWYEYVPEEGVAVLTGRSSKKARLIEAAGRFSLCAQREALPYRYVSVEGPVTNTTTPTAAESERMAIRYLGEEQGRAYAADLDEADQMRVVMRPERWLTVDYAKS